MHAGAGGKERKAPSVVGTCTEPSTAGWFDCSSMLAGGMLAGGILAGGILAGGTLADTMLAPSMLASHQQLKV